MARHSPALDRLCRRLHRAFGPRLSTDPEALVAVGGDESGLPSCPPGAVIWPESTAEICTISRAAAELGVGLVPRGGGTGKAGGCIPTPAQMVVDLSRLNRVLDLRPRDMYALVEPGVITGQFDELVGEEGYMYPPDPGSRDSCTIGGNIATNAGGARAFKYGVTQRYVWRLDVVLPGGELLRTGRLSLKGVAGLDLASLLVGSEGTLGFIAQAAVHIIPKPPEVQTAWLSFASLAAASRAAEQVFTAGIVPRMVEVMDELALELVRGGTPFRVPDAGAGLLVETDGQPGVAMEELTRLCEIAVDHGATDSAIAMSEQQREAMRRARRLVSSRLKEDYPEKISDDIALPRSRMVELLEEARAAGESEGLTVSAYGHLGDGNLHLNILCRGEEERQRGLGLQRRLLGFVVSRGGTISGEHGIGILKRKYLPLEQPEELLAFQRRLKGLFDPRGIMNPGKVL